jgi:Domain of unknown function (DUF4430)
VLRRSFAGMLLVLAFVAAACGSDSATGVSSTQPQAAVLVTTDCGAKVLIQKATVEPGETAMRSLDRVADIETDSGGKFVTSIEGVEQNTGKKLAWLYYVNGKAAQKGAAEVQLAAGDVEWWDLHNWEKECASVPPAAQ